MTELVFRDNSYARSCTARVIAADARGIRLDRTVFYPTGGGQPGDTGVLLLASGETVAIADTVKGEGADEVIHVPAPGAALPDPGAEVTAEIDWERRHRLMRMHTCLHLLCSLVKFPVTGGQVNPDDSRLDSDIDDASAVDKDRLTADLNALIAADHPVSERWISDAELEASPGLVRTMAVKPPMGTGRVRLVLIGENGSVDMQPCGGTHVRRTGEIGRVAVTRIEKKGKLNRRIRVSFA